MSVPIIVKVSERDTELRKLIAKADDARKPRLKMLLAIVRGMHNNSQLAAKTGSGVRSIIRWKNTYTAGGLDALLSDDRGGDFRSGISVADKQKIKEKLCDPKDAFTSFNQAQAWINKELGTDKKYHAVNKYLKRNFGASLKVGRKSHVKKDEAAVAVFKKPL